MKFRTKIRGVIRSLLSGTMRAVKETPSAFSPKLFLSLAVIFLASFILLAHNLDRSYVTMKCGSEVQSEPLTKESVYRQNFKCQADGLEIISVQFFSQNPMQTKTSKLEVTLLSDAGGEIEHWEVEAARIKNFNYYPFRLKQPIENSNGKTYALVITSNAEPENALVAAATSEMAYHIVTGVSGLTLNGKPVETSNPMEPQQMRSDSKNLCMELRYSIPFSESAIKAIARFLIAGALFLLALVVSERKGLQFERQFLALWIFASALFSCAMPPLSITFGDELEHFSRAFEISQGHLVSEYDSELKTSGRHLPFSKGLLLSVGSGWHSYDLDREAARLGNEEAFVEFPEKSVYAPVSYLPQAVGMFIARLFTDSISSIANAGRFLNWLCMTLLFFFAVKLLPRGREFLAFVLLLPLNVYEAVLLSPDGMVIALSALMIAVTLHLRHVQETPLSKRQLTLLYALAIWLSLCKLVYLPLCLVYLLIPRERFHSKNGKLFHALIMAAVVLTLNLGWLAFAGSHAFHPGADMGRQLAFVIAKPLHYVVVLCSTFIAEWLTLLKELLGSRLGDWEMFDHTAIKLVVVLSAIQMAVLFVKGRVKNSAESFWKTRLCFGVATFVTAMLIALSEYLYWTELCADAIEGMHGRYFLYALLPLYFVLAGKTSPDEQPEKFTLLTKSTIVLVNLLAGMPLLFGSL